MFVIQSDLVILGLRIESRSLHSLSQQSCILKQSLAIFSLIHFLQEVSEYVEWLPNFNTWLCCCNGDSLILFWWLVMTVASINFLMKGYWWVTNWTVTEAYKNEIWIYSGSQNSTDHLSLFYWEYTFSLQIADNLLHYLTNFWNISMSFRASHCSPSVKPLMSRSNPLGNKF